MTVITTKLAILLVFHQIMAYHHKTYCWPTRKKLQLLIYNKKQRLYSLSWIDDCLYWLKVHRYIVSYRNYGRYTNGTIYSKASNRQLTRKALATISKTGIHVLKKLWRTGTRITKGPETPPHFKENPLPPSVKVPMATRKNPFLDPVR